MGKEIKLNLSVREVVNLVEAETLTKETGAEALNQFTKKDLIQGLLEDEFETNLDDDTEDIEDGEESPVLDAEVKEVKKEKKESQEVDIDLDDDFSEDDDDLDIDLE